MDENKTTMSGEEFFNSLSEREQYVFKIAQSAALSFIKEYLTLLITKIDEEMETGNNGSTKENSEA